MRGWWGRSGRSPCESRWPWASSRRHSEHVSGGDTMRTPVRWTDREKPLSATSWLESGPPRSDRARSVPFPLALVPSRFCWRLAWDGGGRSCLVRKVAYSRKSRDASGRLSELLTEARKQVEPQQSLFGCPEGKVLLNTLLSNVTAYGFSVFKRKNAYRSDMFKGRDASRLQHPFQTRWLGLTLLLFVSSAGKTLDSDKEPSWVNEVKAAKCLQGPRREARRDFETAVRAGGREARCGVPGPVRACPSPARVGRRAPACQGGGEEAQPCRAAPTRGVPNLPAPKSLALSKLISHIACRSPVSSVPLRGFLVSCAAVTRNQFWTFPSGPAPAPGHP